MRVHNIPQTLIVTNGYLSYCFLSICPFLTSDPQHQQEIFLQTTTANLIFFIFHTFLWSTVMSLRNNTKYKNKKQCIRCSALTSTMTCSMILADNTAIDCKYFLRYSIYYDCFSIFVSQISIFTWKQFSLFFFVLSDNNIRFQQLLRIRGCTSKCITTTIKNVLSRKQKKTNRGEWVGT